MEELIPLFIFVLIWIVTLVGKLGSKKKSAGILKQSKPQGILTALNQFFAKIQQQIEAQKRMEQGTANRSPWQRLTEEGPEPEDEFEDLPELTLEPDKSSILSQNETPVKAREKKSRHLDKPDLPLHSSPQPISACTSHGKGRSGFSAGRRRLRRAVVWSEILGPPVALRNRSEDRW